MSVDEMITILQAFKDGRKIECRLADDETDAWSVTSSPSFNFYEFEYRAARQPREWWVNVYDTWVEIYPTVQGADRNSSDRNERVHVREVLEG